MNINTKHGNRPVMKLIPSSNSKWLPGCVVFTLSMLVYLITLAPTVTGEDSGELIAAAYGGGVAHPPGYPLWTMLASLSIKILPLGTVAYRVNLLSAVLAAISATVLWRTVTRFFSVLPWTAALGSVCFACGRHFWSQAVITEVYTLHVLLTCLILHFALIWRETSKNKYLYIVSFLTGLGLCNHHLAVLLGPLLFAFVLFHKPRLFISWKLIMMCILFLAIGLTPYLYLPVAAGKSPYVNWGNPDNWQRFLEHVFRKQYGDESMHLSRTLHRLFGHLGILWNWISQQYTIAAIPLLAGGLVVLARKNKRLLCITILFFLMHTVVLAELLNISFNRQELFCSRVFFLPAYISAIIWITVGGEHVGQSLSQVFARYKSATSLRFFPLTVLLILAFWGNFGQNNMRHYFFAIDHADNILKSLDKNAILIPSGDHNTFPLIYRHYVEGYRPDIVIADKYGYIEYDLYKTMPNAPKKISTRRQRENIESHIIANSKRPVYYTVKPRMDLLSEYKTVSYGMLFRIFPKEDNTSDIDYPHYRYRNLEEEESVIDHAASVILSDYHFHLASNALRKNRVDEALANVEKAASLSHGLKEEMNNLGTLLAEFGMDELAVNYYEQAARLGKDYLTPRWNLAYVFKARGDIVPAIQVFNDLARIDTEDFRAYGELGFLLFRHGDVELAIQNWGKSLALNPNQPQIVKALGRLFEKEKPETAKTPK